MTREILIGFLALTSTLGVIPVAQAQIRQTPYSQRTICETQSDGQSLRQGDALDYVLTNFGKVLGQTRGSTVNARSGPSLTAPVIGTVRVGDDVTVWGEGRDENCHTWYQVQLNGSQSGYVYARFLRITGNENGSNF